MTVIEGMYRYFTADEIEKIIKENRENQIDVWYCFQQFSSEKQDRVYTFEKEAIEELTNAVNCYRTKNLLEVHIKIKGKYELIDFVIDIEKAIEKLSQRQKYCVEKHFFEQYLQIEIAEELNIKKNTVCKHIREAIENITKYLSR